MTVAQMFAAYNQLAPPRKAPRLKTARGLSRIELAQRLMILRTQKVVVDDTARGRKSTHRDAPLRDCIMKMLAHVDYYEHKLSGKIIRPTTARKYRRDSLFSVGLPYREVKRRLIELIPDANISDELLRWTAHQMSVRAEGFIRYRPPQKRPHGSKGKTRD